MEDAKWELEQLLRYMARRCAGVLDITTIDMDDPICVFALARLVEHGYLEQIDDERYRFRIGPCLH